MFQVFLLPCCLGLCDQIIEAFVDNFQVTLELPLPGYQILGKWKVPIRKICGGTVLSFLEHTINSLCQSHKSKVTVVWWKDLFFYSLFDEKNDRELGCRFFSTIHLGSSHQEL